MPSFPFGDLAAALSRPWARVLNRAGLHPALCREARARRHNPVVANALACGKIIGAAHGFVGDREHHDDHGNSMLDLVLTRRRGLPILLSVVYVEVARRAGIQIAGVGFPGHFVVGHFSTS